jgi:hypothetical protein
MADRPIDVAELVAEVANANFEDERLNKRLKTLVEVLAKDPDKSLPRAFDSAGLEAAYRFFSNVHVTPEDPFWALRSDEQAMRRRRRLSHRP